MAAVTCDLCGLPVLGRPVGGAGDGVGGTFCCEGCARVHAVAVEHGIVTLTDGPVRAQRGAEAARRRAAAAAAAGARRATLGIDGMWCASCALVLAEALLALPGVLDAEVSYAASLARVTYDPAMTDAAAIAGRIELLGYGARPGGLAAGAVRSGAGEAFLRFFVSLVVGMWVMVPTFFVLWPAFAHGRWADMLQVELFTGGLALVVLLYGGWPFLVGAWRAAAVGRATMDTLVVLGTWTAWGYSVIAAVTGQGPTYFESASMITTIVLLGRWVEALGRGDVTAALTAAAAGMPVEAWLVPDGGEARDAQRVPAASLAAGARVMVRAGERVPADGVLESPRASLDESRLTGEARPAEKAAGDEVWAGTMAADGPFLVAVTRAGGDTLAGRIAALVEDAAFAKSHLERVTDAAAGLFVPAVLAIAAATVLVTAAGGSGAPEAVRRAVTVLVVACPCALGLAAPLAVLNASARLAAAGVVVRGGEVLERAGEITTVAFDKTGTLTHGRLQVTGVVPAGGRGCDAQRLLETARMLETAAVASGDGHPVALAIAAALADEPTPTEVAQVSDLRVRPGLGVEGTLGGARVVVGSERLLALEGIAPDATAAGEVAGLRDIGRSVVWVAEAGRALGALVLEDTVRPEASRVVAALARDGVRTVLVSGDAQTTCRAVAAAVGIDDARGDVLPHDKEGAVRALREQGPVAFVGDGINDAPALAAADLAVAIADASEVALLASDVVLGNNAEPLSALPEVLRTARRTRRVIMQNLAWAFTYNAVAVPLAIAGLLSPVAAAAAMAVSSLAVVANSLRLRSR